MPIRMEKDNNSGGKKHNPGGGNRPSNNAGGGISSLLPLIFSIVLKKPKLLIILLIIAGLFYFFGGQQFLFDNQESASADYGTGMSMKQEIYDQAEVFEPLSDNKKNPMPERVSLLEYAPARLNQGRQGSCVGWASSYAARTILHARQTGQNPNRVVFSPAYVYNQIQIPNSSCQGAYMLDAMKTLHQDGDLLLNQFPYDETTCNAQPNSSARSAAAQYRIKGYNRLSMDHDKYAVNMLAIKQNLAQGAPVVIGMQVGGSFMQDMMGREIWKSTNSDRSLRGFGGHAMCVIGYDDYKGGNEGAFQIMNSWGSDWGVDGVGWVLYSDFEYFVKEAYGLYPMGDANNVTSTALSVNFGLVDNQTGKNIVLKQEKDNLFSTVKPIKKGDKFKVEITNTVECYVYVFGQETDGSSYTLFPYTAKHSPYCGITGTRLFPKDYSMVADEKGNRDYISAIFTKTPLDYDQLNAAINSASGNDYAAKVNNALVDSGLKNLSFTAGETIGFKVQNMKNNQAVATVIAIDKY
jgi:C1A family cysteine protease